MAAAYNVLGHQNTVNRVAFDPQATDWQLAASTERSSDREVPRGRFSAQDSSGLAAQVSVAGSEAVADLAFDDAGNRLAVAVRHRARVWDVKRQAAPAVVLNTLKDLPFGVAPLALAWSPDGTRLALGLSDGTTVIVDPTGEVPPVSLPGQHGRVLDVCLQPGRHVHGNGKRGWNRTRLGGRLDCETMARAATPSPLHTLRGHASGVNAVTFSPDGGTLVTAGEDGAVELWDVKTGRARYTLAALPAPVTGVTFSPNGVYLATSGDAVRVFLLRLDDLVALAEQRTSRSLTADECHQYLHVESGACVSPTPRWRVAQPPCQREVLSETTGLIHHAEFRRPRPLGDGLRPARATRRASRHLDPAALATANAYTPPPEHSCATSDSTVAC